MIKRTTSTYTSPYMQALRILTKAAQREANARPGSLTTAQYNNLQRVIAELVTLDKEVSNG